MALIVGLIIHTWKAPVKLEPEFILTDDIEHYPNTAFCTCELDWGLQQLENFEAHYSGEENLGLPFRRLFPQMLRRSYKFYSFACTLYLTFFELDLSPDILERMAKINNAEIAAELARTHIDITQRMREFVE